MEYLEDVAWEKADPNDLWIFDKLIVSRKLGYICGPVGVDVPKPDSYIVRPCVNILGMSRGAEFVYLEKDTMHLPAGYFWCERFNGRHISVDYLDGQQILAVEGFKEDLSRLYRFSKWQKVDDTVPLPSIFYSLTKKYRYINIEFIDGNPIEIHLRHNPDFVHGNSVAYPVWNDNPIMMDMQGLKYIEAPDYLRKGFWID